MKKSLKVQVPNNNHHYFCHEKALQDQNQTVYIQLAHKNRGSIVKIYLLMILMCDKKTPLNKLEAYSCLMDHTTKASPVQKNYFQN